MFYYTVLKENSQISLWITLYHFCVKITPAQLALSLSKDGPILFRNANSTKKRAILEIVGSNLALTDKRLSIDAKKPFRRWAGKPGRSQMWTYGESNPNLIHAMDP